MSDNDRIMKKRVPIRFNKTPDLLSTESDVSIFTHENTIPMRKKRFMTRRSQNVTNSNKLTLPPPDKLTVSSLKLAEPLKDTNRRMSMNGYHSASRIHCVFMSMLIIMPLLVIIFESTMCFLVTQALMQQAANLKCPSYLPTTTATITSITSTPNKSTLEPLSGTTIEATTEDVSSINHSEATTMTTEHNNQDTTLEIDKETTKVVLPVETTAFESTSLPSTTETIKLEDTSTSTKAIDKSTINVEVTTSASTDKQTTSMIEIAIETTIGTTLYKVTTPEEDTTTTVIPTIAETELTTEILTTTKEPSANNCPANTVWSSVSKKCETCIPPFDYYGTYCYYINKTLTLWKDAKKYCENMNSRLVIIESEDEFQSLNTKIPNTQNYWLGSGDLYSNNTNYWVDSTLVQSPEEWFYNYDDYNFSTGKCCLTCLTEPITLCYADCNIQKAYICKI